jgi:hypothetical protein
MNQLFIILLVLVTLRYDIMAIRFIIEVIKKNVEGADAEHISLVQFTLNLSYNWN